MQRVYILVVVSICLVVISCKEYEKEQLYGKWSTSINNNYYELWFYPNVVLDFKPFENAANKMNYEVAGDSIEFYLLYEDSTYHAYTYKIISLSNTELQVEIPTSRKRYTYKKINMNFENHLNENNLDKYYNEYYKRR